MTEIKRNVPELRFEGFEGDWKQTRIDKISKVSSGGTPSRTNPAYWNGNIPWITTSLVDFNIILQAEQYITEIGLNNSSAKLFEKDTILMAMYGQGKTRGQVAVLGIDATTNQACAAINVNEGSNHLFMFQLLKGQYENLRELSNDGGQKNLSAGLIKAFRFKTPFLPEQTKIANFLTAVDSKISNLSEEKTLLENYKKGAMQKIFSQEIRFKDDEGNDFADWETKRLGEIANLRRGSFPQPYGLKKWYDDVNGFPFIQVFDVDNNLRLKETTKRKISNAAKKLSVFIEKGTLILTIQGSIGRMAITEYDACIDRTLLIFQSYNLPIDKTYFMYVVYLLFEFEKHRAVGGTIKTITKEKIKKFTVDLPTIIEQTKIANFLTSIDKKIEVVTSALERTQAFKKGLLQKLFV